jgi:hypothetical protein
VIRVARRTALAPLLLAAACASRDPDASEPVPRAAAPLPRTSAPPIESERATMSIPKSTSTVESAEPSARPEVWTRCSSDPDCVMIPIDPATCCSDCVARAVTRAELAEATDRCAETKVLCAPDDCPSQPRIARCQDHVCVPVRISPPRS